MALDYRARYVEGMRNIVWLAGYLRKRGDEWVIQQNNNNEQSIPLVVGSNFNMPSEYTPVEAACHVFGARINDEQQCMLRLLEIGRPSTRTMPPFSTWLRGRKGTDEFRPFMSGGEVKREILDKIDADENASDLDKELADVIRTSGGRFDSRLGENSNKAIIAGYVGAYRYVEPNEHQKHGYGEVFLMQHEGLARAIPVRVYNSQVHSILKSLKKGEPVAINGQVRFKVMPNEDGTIKSVNLHIRTDDTLTLDKEKDFLGDPPDWWNKLWREGRREMAAKIKAAGQITVLGKDSNGVITIEGSSL